MSKKSGSVAEIEDIRTLFADLEVKAEASLKAEKEKHLEPLRKQLAKAEESMKLAMKTRDELLDLIATVTGEKVKKGMGKVKGSKTPKAVIEAAIPQIMTVLGAKEYQTVADTVKKSGLDADLVKTVLAKLKREKKIESNGIKGRAGGNRKL